jgi:hypothetical protein
MRRNRLILITGLICLLSAPVMWAQDYRASISGIVSDPSGAVIPGAAVKAIRIDTNETKEVATTSDGNYTIPYLIPSTYDVEFSATGFQTVKRKGIVLRVADKLNLSVQLPIGTLTQEVTVMGQQEVIETGSADRGLVFDPVKVQEYPLNGRQTYMLMSLTPGVIFTQEVFGNTGFSGTRGWDVNSSYKINGARTGQNLFLLNGAPISDNSGTWSIAPNVEAVQEFKVMTNTYDSSYGRFGGGVVNTTLKSGNKVFDANSFQNNIIGAPKAKHNQHQWGGIVGGPIRKDKDFIFASFEGWRERIGFPAVTSTPPLTLRDGKGFPALGYKIYDPTTTHICGSKPGETSAVCQGSTYIRDPFPGNVIPDSRISPIAKAIIGYYPAPNAAGLDNNFVAGGNVGRYFYNQPMARWDHIFSKKDNINVTFTFQHGQEYRDQTGWGPPAASGDVGSQRTQQSYIIAWTHVFSPTKVLDVRGGWGRFTAMFPRYTDFDLTWDKLGMSGMIKAPTWEKNTVPRIDLGGYTNLFACCGTMRSWNTYNQANFTPSLTWIRGKHTLRTGFELNYVSRGDISPGYSNGNFTFNQTWTRQLSDRSQGTYDGSAIASLLLGVPASGSIDWNDDGYRSRPYYGFYVQDDWKLNSRLTLNLGLRYDIQVPWLERFNRVTRGFDLSTKNPNSDAVLAAWAKYKTDYDATKPKYPYPAPPSQLTGGYLFAAVGGQPSRLYDTDWTNVAPRIGMAWRITNKTVLRAGSGVYYMSPTQNGVVQGFSQSTPYTSSLDGVTPSAGLTGPYSLQNPFPNGLNPASKASLGLSTNVGNSVSFDPPHFKIPRTYQYSVGIQRELPHGIMVEASFAGNYQIYINFSQNQNNVSLEDNNRGFADNSYLNRTMANPFYGVLPKTSGLGGSPTISSFNLLRPDPIFQSITNNLVQKGHYRSDAFQTKIEKPVFSGSTRVLTLVLSYTFAKAYEANHRLNDWNTAEPLMYEVDNTDKPHNLSFHGIWDLPFGTGRKLNISNPVGNAVAGNWRFDWVFTYLSGYPVGWPNLINYCGEWHAATQNEDHWFNNNKSCYKTFPSYNLRTIPDRFPDIRNPSKPQLNVALEKTFHFTERYRLQFRGESFNVTNTPIRPGPNTDFNSASFGTLTKMQNNFPRVIQFAAKLFF